MPSIFAHCPTPGRSSDCAEAGSKCYSFPCGYKIIWDFLVEVEGKVVRQLTLQVSHGFQVVGLRGGHLPCGHIVAAPSWCMWTPADWQLRDAVDINAQVN